eukprot:1892035-Amphidinium_carterae.1
MLCITERFEGMRTGVTLTYLDTFAQDPQVQRACAADFMLLRIEKRREVSRLPGVCFTSTTLYSIGILSEVTWRLNRSTPSGSSSWPILMRAIHRGCQTFSENRGTSGCHGFWIQEVKLT